MKKKFRFQRRNGYIFDGAFEIAIKDHVAEIEEANITTSIKGVIEANGGQEIVERPEPITFKTGKSKKEVRENDSAST